MNKPEPSIRVKVDVTNPGQFFACCGLLELADRLWPGAEGWFEERLFCIACGGELDSLIKELCNVELIQVDPNNKTASPIAFGTPIAGLYLDWWFDEMAGGKKMKVWAGTMESVKIARALQLTMHDEQFSSPELFDVGMVAYDPDNPKKKVEPYYFDSRRGPNAHSRDVGFSPNTLKLTTTAFPAVELLCLVGLQRCLPTPTNRRHVYEYCSWDRPVPTVLLSSIVSGAMSWPGGCRYRFENWYRTGQKKHQAFRSAVEIS